MDKKTNNNKIAIYFYDLLLVFISTLGIINIFLLSLKSFKPAYSIILSLLLFSAFMVIFNKNLSTIFRDKRFTVSAVVLLLAAVLIRLPPTLYLLGGQDQGTYISISKQYELDNKLYMVDEFRETLTENQKELYDRDGNYIMPSFEKWNRPNSEYSMRFYPAYPSYLSISSFLLGSNNRLLFLTLFSAITLVNSYLITYHLTKNKRTSLVVMLLFSINPLHLFFSKFPVGEVPALAFSSSGLYFLLRYLRQKNISYKNGVYLIFSLMSFFVFSFTRLTFFIYIPILLLIALLNYHKNNKLVLTFYSIANIFILGFTYIYYRLLMFPLYNGLYPKTIGFTLDKIIPLNIETNLKILIFLILLALIFVLFSNKKFYNLFSKTLKHSYVLLSSVFIYIIYHATVKDFDILFSGSNTALVRWNMLYRGFDAIKHATLISIVNYVSIVGFIIFVSVVLLSFFRKKVSVYHILAFISTYFLFIYVYKTGFVRYDYYNSRYFIVEVVPAILLTVGIFLGEIIQKKRTRIVGCVFLMLTSFYFLIFSVFQIGKYEGVDVNFFNNIDNKINDDSIILFVNKNIYPSKYPLNFNSYVAGPMKYYFGKNILALRSQEELLDKNVLEISERFQNVYFLSNVPISESYAFEYQEKITLNYYHFNNSPGCGYHNYEFLRIDSIKEIPLPSPLNCMLLPNAYYERSRDYYFGKFSKVF